MQKSIEKLPQEVVNQIAAGEVIERPASVVKELVDNSIDANSTKITIKINKGGSSLIEVADNGVGIPGEDLEKAFVAHTTSKLTSLEDLNDLITMGFRGEALSTIISVSDVEVISRSVESEYAYKLHFNGIEPEERVEHPREVGTTVIVRDLFKEIPARLKFLRSAETEYRNILKLLTPYFLANPSIHFILIKDGKEVHNLPAIKGVSEEQLNEERIKNTIRSEFTSDLIPLFFDGSGIKVSGFVASPKHHSKRTTVNYTFLNGRPITDRGVYRSVMEGFGSFIPSSDKIPFIISLSMPQSMVDINVHPRKEEVKFLNPYRVYGAVEQAVKDALSKEYSGTSFMTSSSTSEDNAYSRLRGTDSSRIFDQEGRDVSSMKGVKEYTPPPTASSVQSSIQFSKELLKDTDTIPDSTRLIGDENLQVVSVNQIFKKYIVLEFEDQLWIVDQHAAAERITFEKLKSNYEEGEKDIQNLLMPEVVALTEEERSYFEENQDYFGKLGFGYDLNDTTIEMNHVPVEFSDSDIETLIKDLVSEDGEDDQRTSEVETQKDDILATIACHNSIRSNHKLEREEAYSLVKQLMECENPYSCPHGRPIVWQMSLNEIDSHFDRTY